MDLGQVFTKAHVADYMAGLFSLGRDAKLLDACFGEGAFLRALAKRGYTDVTGYEIDRAVYEKAAAAFPSFRLHCGDFLQADEAGRYDGVIMNPPYIRQEKIDDLKPLGITKAILKSNLLFQNLPSAANLYMYFIMQAIHLLKQGGELIVIFPSSWMQARSGRKFRQELLAKCMLEKEIYIAGDVFETEALVEVVIFKLIKGAGKRKSAAVYLEARDGAVRPRCGYQAMPVLDAADGIPMAKALNLLDARKPSGFQTAFSQLAKVRRGITTGCNAMYMNPGFQGPGAYGCTRQILATPKAITGYTTQGAKTDVLFVPKETEALPEEACAYIKSWEAKIRREQKPKTLYEKLRAGDAAWFALREVDSRGILFSYFVRNDMKFVMNTQGYLARDNFYIIYPLIDPLLLFSLLNNYYTYYQLELVGKKYGAGLLKLQRYDIEALKFPDYKYFTEHDCSRLKQSAQALIDTGDKGIIGDMTRVVGAYAPVGYEEIREQYRLIKQHRLEGEGSGDGCGKPLFGRRRP